MSIVGLVVEYQAVALALLQRGRRRLFIEALAENRVIPRFLLRFDPARRARRSDRGRAEGSREEWKKCV